MGTALVSFDLLVFFLLTIWFGTTDGKKKLGPIISLIGANGIDDRPRCICINVVQLGYQKYLGKMVGIPFYMVIIISGRCVMYETSGICIPRCPIFYWIYCCRTSLLTLSSEIPYLWIVGPLARLAALTSSAIIQNCQRLLSAAAYGRRYGMFVVIDLHQCNNCGGDSVTYTI